MECANIIEDIGAAARNFGWKITRAEEAAVAIGGEQAYAVRGCWVVRATRHNRALVGRYPEVFAARFPGSSVMWTRSIRDCTEPPLEPGLIWASVPARACLPGEGGDRSKAGWGGLQRRDCAVEALERSVRAQRDKRVE